LKASPLSVVASGWLGGMAVAATAFTVGKGVDRRGFGGG
jgi:hypothetical protein